MDTTPCWQPIVDGLWQRQAREAPPQSLPLTLWDTVIFDIDGVLLDVRGSFRHAITATVGFYLEHILHWPASLADVRPDETEWFKLAGRFNNDWDITEAIILFYLWRRELYRARLQTVEGGPGLKDFARMLKKYGGGMQAVKPALEALGQEFELPLLDASFWRETGKRCDRDTLVRIFGEFYAGQRLFEELYGQKPEYLQRAHGLIEKEKPLVDAELAAGSGRKLAVLTGRLWREAQVALEMTGMERLIRREQTLTEDGPYSKPDGRAIQFLAARLASTGGVFIGDTLDDLATVQQYRHLVPNGPKFWFCGVLTGAHGEGARDIFLAEGADLLARDVNALLRWIT